jgi:hypothetical protein
MRTQTYGSLIAVLVLALSGSARAATTYGPVSVAGDGSIGNATSGGGDYWPISVSADGNEVAFVSSATNLVPGVTPIGNQVFLRNRSAGTTQLVSVGDHGQQINAYVLRFHLSPNGRYLAFETTASNVTANQPSGGFSTYVRDLVAGETTYAENTSQYFSLDDNGHVWPDTASVTPDGHYTVGYESSAGQEVILTDTTTGTHTRVDTGADGTPANGGSSGYAAAISANGRYVVFWSNGNNLAPGTVSTCVPNQCGNLFRKDLQTGQIISLTSALAGNGDVGQTPSVSADGNVVSFCSINMAGADEPSALRNYAEVQVANIAAGTIHDVSYDDAVGLINPHSFDCPSALDAAGDTVFLMGTAGAMSYGQVWAEPAGRGVISLAGQPTTTTLSVSPNPSAFGRPVTLTATVIPGDGNGTVSFYLDGSSSPISGCGSQSLSLASSGYQARCTTSSLGSPGMHTITATYSGDSQYAGSSGTAAETVAKAVTSLAAAPAVLSISPLNAYLLTLTATLTAYGQPVAGQSVDFTAGGSKVCTAVTSATGVARCNALGNTQAALAVITGNGYTATFGGSDDYLGSSGTAGLIG